MAMEKINGNRNYLLLCIFYIVYYITLGVFAPYLNVYYERLGFSGTEIGLITSVGLIASMLMTPVWGAVSDKTRNPRGMIAFLLLGSALSGWLWYAQSDFTPVFVMSVLLSVFRNNVWSLIDGVGVQLCSEVNKDFAFARSMGSLGYLLGSFLIGNLLVLIGMKGPYMEVFILCSIAAAVLILLIPAKGTQEKKKSEVRFTESVKSLFTNRNYLFVLAMMLLTNMVVDCILNYSGNHLISTLNQSDAMIGIFSCAQVLPEIIIVMFANRMFRKMSVRQIFMLGALAQLVRFFFSAISLNVVVFLMATTLHGFTIAVSSVGYVTYIHKNVDAKILATAMALYGTVCTIGSALINQMFGYVYQYASSTMLFWIGFLCAAVAVILILLNRKIDGQLN